MTNRTGTQLARRSYANGLLGCLFIFVTILVGASGNAGAREDSVLDEWLRTLEIDLPEESLHAAGGVVEVMNMTCSNITVGSLGSSSSRERHLLFVEVTGASLGCNGTFIYKRRSFPSIRTKGEIHARAENGRMSIGAQLEGQPLADRAVVPDSSRCSSSLKIANLDIDGDMLASLVEPLVRVLSPFIRSRVERKICSTVEDAIEGSLSRKLRQIRDPLDRLLHLPSAPLPSRDLPGSLDLEDNPGIELLRIALSRNPGPRFLSNLIHDATSGSMEFAQTYHAQFHPQNAAQVDIKGSHFRADGIDSLHTIHGPIAVGANRAMMNISLDELRLSAKALVYVRPKNGKIEGEVLHEECDVHVHLRDVRLGLAFFLSLDEKGVKGLQGDQLAKPQCIASRVKQANISSLNVDFDVASADISPLGRAGRLEREVDKVINSLSNVLVSQYQSTLETMTSRVLGGPILYACICHLQSFIPTLFKHCCPLLNSSTFLSLANLI